MLSVQQTVLLYKKDNHSKPINLFHIKDLYNVVPHEFHFEDDGNFHYASHHVLAQSSYWVLEDTCCALMQDLFEAQFFAVMQNLKLVVFLFKYRILSFKLLRRLSSFFSRGNQLIFIFCDSSANIQSNRVYSNYAFYD